MGDFPILLITSISVRSIRLAFLFLIHFELTVYFRSNVKVVRLGDHNIRSNADDKNVQEIPVETIIFNPSFRPPMKYNDIALVKLSRDVNFTPFVRPACLHTSSKVLSGAKVNAIGWGKVNFGELSADTLHKVYLDIFSYEDCRKMYDNVSPRALKRGIDDDTMVCAGGKDSSKDTCRVSITTVLLFGDICSW